MLRRLGVRGKILATLAVPVLVLFLAAAFISAQAVGEARAAAQTRELVDVLALQDRAGTAFAAERALNVAAEAGTEGAAEALAAARADTDTALAARDRALADIDVSALDPRVQEAIDATLADVDALAELRDGIDRSRIVEVPATNQYSRFLDRALAVPRELADTTADRDLALRLNAYVLLDELAAHNTEERPVASILIASVKAGAFDVAAQELRMARLVAEGDDIADDTQAYLDRIPGGLTIPPVEGTYNIVRTNLAQQSPQSVTQLQQRSWPDASQAWLDELTPVRDTVRDGAESYSADLARDATTQTVVTVLVALGIIAASVAVALLIARRLVSPLRRLTEAAAEVRDRLPTLVEQVAVPGQGPAIDLAPIEVESDDEIGRLAVAFNDVNRTTVDVAREQAALRGSIAEMFVNVARRDQVLLNRQLAFLDDLERSEEDPSTLSNLFRLDHLATRMRRNAESLLVLAGIDSGRRVRQPMPVSDVIRTASSEIELYDRVRLNLVVDPLMLGHNALNAAHLVAELLENATMFSEPHTPVEVTTAREPGAVVVAVRDHGLGMTPEEIAEANRKVAAHAASDVVGAQRLGLFVVGRLADRLGVRVSFGPGPDGSGTQVVVTFPEVLFVPDGAVPLPQPTDPLAATTQDAAQQLLPQRGAPAAAGGPAAPAAAPVVPVTATTPVVEPEAPVAVPVDLDALTDGTTATGMPRRRSRGIDTAATPSVSYAAGPQTGSIILPPLATPQLPLDLPVEAEAAWTPPEQVAPAAASLPSRHRTVEPAPADEAEDEVPVLDVTSRSAMFSSFRSMNTFGAQQGQESVALEASPDVDPATLPDHGAGAPDDTTVLRVPVAPATDEPWAPVVAPEAAEAVVVAPVEPQTPATETWAPVPAEEAWVPVDGTAHGAQQGAQQAAPAAAPETAPEGTADGWSPQEAFEPLAAEERTVAPAAAQPAAAQPVAAQPVTEPRPDETAVWTAPLVGEAAAPAAAAAEPVPAPAPQAWEPPAVAAAPLPARSSVLRAQPAEAAAAPAAPAPVAQAPGLVPVAEAAPQAAPAQPQPDVVPHAAAAGPASAGPAEDIPEELRFEALPRFEELMADLPTRRSLRESNRKRGLFGRRPARPAAAVARPAAPAAAAGAAAASRAVAPAPQPAAPQPVAPQPVAQPAAPAPQAAPAAAEAWAPPAAPVQPAAPVAPAAWQPPTAPQQVAPAPQAASPQPVAAVPTAAPTAVPTAVPAAPEAQAAVGAPTPLVRRPLAEQPEIEPLDADYVRDSVEARSDWMASAVLFEEMSTLLDRGSLPVETASAPEEGYRPAAVAPEAAGLARRPRNHDPEGYVDRFTARIDRDPEQLRARLSAFQSGTARGRVEGEDETGSTWDVPSVNHVPDSAPQAR